jgi:hypothetical protein
MFVIVMFVVCYWLEVHKVEYLWHTHVGGLHEEDRNLGPALR